ncbi:MAG: hypothetical protein H6672_16910 [Anaerolineaceae bacterium]|nr:hypothetical protein [Anaerolineaceae bacterium]
MSKFARILWLFMGFLAACQTAYLSNNTPEGTATLSETAQVRSTSNEWAELASDGVRLRLKVPSGWQARSMDDGILIAQEFSTMFADDNQIKGIQMHLFVHYLEEFDLPANDPNIAESVLNQIVQIPEYVGRAAVSVPRGFHWDQYDAAYYLLNSGDGTITMLLALIVEDPPRMIVCNINAPLDKAAHIRMSLPLVFGDFTINGQQVDVSALYRLPFPLEFPTYMDSRKSH